jgi:hypothetical protein
MTAKPVTFYLPDDLLIKIDQKRGKLSRSLFVKLLLTDALNRKIELGKLITEA